MQFKKSQVLKKYGKSSESLREIKKAYFDDIELLVKREIETCDYYRQQKTREKCKNCNHKLSKTADFTKYDVGFVFCEKCNHLNGQYEDTNEFNNFIYTADGGERFQDQGGYVIDNESEYLYRVNSIYMPKAEFLYTSVLSDGGNPNNLSYFDFGAGSGYFLRALKSFGINNLQGSDVSKIQVKFGNEINKQRLLKIHNHDQTINILKSLKVDVLSLLGVLEHLKDPAEALSAISTNKNIKYVFISLPMFSLAVIFELLFPQSYHRSMRVSSGHTHLYTEESISYFVNKFKFQRVSEWRFGTDIVDLHRHMLAFLKNINSSAKIYQCIDEKMQSLTDSLQLEIDKNNFTSDIHLVLRIR
jgi:2-polyprenyl-3-methyl-5-hydroxy-6-metoxy-1,4-benzoquinol methylase|tara:strand:+ start:124 stop:1200 length:1077 start_codon:yes stop_codon:yes gene_type:complete